MVGVSVIWSSQSILTPGSNNGRDPLLVTLDPATGICTSLNRLVGNNGIDDGFTKMILDNNGDLILGGYMGYQLTDSNNVSYYSNGGTSDFFITKFATQACTPLANESFEKNQGVNFYPNPVNNLLTVEVKENASYTLYNLQGRIIQQGKLTQSNNTIDCSILDAGVYMLEVVDNTTKKQVAKVIRE